MEREEEEEDFENALTDEQPWEVSRDSPDPRWPVPRGGVRGGEASPGEERGGGGGEQEMDEEGGGEPGKRGETAARSRGAEGRRR